MARKPLEPPFSKNPGGKTRRCGIELEFAGLEPKKAADLIAAEYGGKIKKVDEHRYEIDKTSFGKFVAELDFRYAHPSKGPANLPDDFPLREKLEEAIRDADKTISETIGQLGEGVVPTEIICPPIPWDKISELNKLFDSLRKKGALGTDKNILFGFGLHLNPEAAKLTAPYILSVLRAYILLSDWLKHRIRIDITRRIFPFTEPFPRKFALKIMAPNYKPGLEKLIKDYLADNPTRNREFDLLPLFAELKPELVEEALKDEKIKARPTFHYRLPNSNLSDKNWNAVTEWNSWVRVEKLAANPKKLKAAREKFIQNSENPLSRSWRKVSERYAE